MAYTQKNNPFRTSPINKNDDEVKRAVEKWPALENLGDITVKADPKYTYGHGDIEYMSPEQKTIKYGKDRELTHPKSGTHGVVLNPESYSSQEGIDQAVRLDLLHGMKDVDSEFKKHYNTFTNTFSEKHKGDIQLDHARLVKEGYSQGKEKDKQNYVDGIVRNMLFEGDGEEFEKSRYWKDAGEFYTRDSKIKNSFSQMKNYLETNIKNLLPEVEVKESRK